MTGFADTETPAIEFVLSSKSQAAKARQWIWVGLAVGLALSWFQSGFGKSFFISAAITVVAIAVLDLAFFRRQTKPGQVVLTLGTEALESPRFTTKEKKFNWSDIQSASIENTQFGRVLQLQLQQREDRADKRSFVSGVNPAKPSFPLAVLSQADQERLFEVVSERLEAPSFGYKPASPVSNVLTEERLFHERLTALAPKTWVSYGLAGFNVLIWVAMVVDGSGLMQGSADKLLLWGGNAASEVQQGQWWRLLSATFLHSGLFHVLMNMAGLLAAGITVERIYGHRLFVLIYLGAGLIGSAASLHFSAQKAVSVGASGAVFGVAGALLVAVFQHRKQLPKSFSKQTLSGMGFFVLYSLAQGWISPGVDNAAHVGGLLAGVVLALLLPERFNMGHFQQHVKLRAVWAAALVVVVTVGIASIAPRAPFDQSEAVAASAAFVRGLNGLSNAVKAIEQEQKDVLAGKRSEIEADERSRTVHAPNFRIVVQDLRAAKFAGSDPRAVVAKHYTRFAELLLESLAMESDIVDGKPVPADRARAEAIGAELEVLSARIPKQVDQLKAGQKR